MGKMENVVEAPFTRESKAYKRSRGAAKIQQSASARFDRPRDHRRTPRLGLGRRRNRAAPENGDRHCRYQVAQRKRPRFQLALLTALCITGCAGTRNTHDILHAPPPSANQPESGFEELEVSLAGGFIELTLTIPPPLPGQDKQPVIINPIVEQNELLERSIVIARYRLKWPILPKQAPPTKGQPPAEAKPNPKKSVGVWLLASPSAAVIGKGYFSLIWADGNSAKQVIEHLRTLPFVDPDRIGIAGISTNGFKALSAILAGAPLRAAVVVGACPDYHSFLANSPVALGGTSLDLEPEYEAWLNEREPLRQARRLTKTALLLVNGGKDHVIPSQCIENSVPLIRDEYERVGRPDHFHLAWWPDGTHSNLTAIATPTILRWWSRWLGTPADR